MKLESCAEVVTKDVVTGTPNGRLMELQKSGTRTKSYLTVADPGSFKGFHLHRVRTSNFVVIRGSARIYAVDVVHKRWEEAECGPGTRISIPRDVYIGIRNNGEEPVWIVNTPEPAYDPSLVGEQVDEEWVKLRDMAQSEKFEYVRLHT